MGKLSEKLSRWYFFDYYDNVVGKRLKKFKSEKIIRVWPACKNENMDLQVEKGVEFPSIFYPLVTQL